MKAVSATIALGSACLLAFANEGMVGIDSAVIHQYSYADFLIGIVPGHSGSPPMGGFRLDASVECLNALLWGSYGFYAYTSDPIFGQQMELASVGAGYVFRFATNRVNLVPRLAGGYLRVTGATDLFETMATTLSRTTYIEPSLFCSYAFNNRFSLGAGYALAVSVSPSHCVSQFSVGMDVRILKHWGARFEGTIATNPDYNGIFAGITGHF